MTAADAKLNEARERWELVEVLPGGEPHVVGHYTDEQRARSACLAVQCAGAPVEPGDIWDEADYYVRTAE